MDTQTKFQEKITAAYANKGASIFLGAGILDGKVFPKARINLTLKMMNRHGLIAGATGTGKTRTLQLIAEQLSDAGVPVFMLDVKGDLSGLHQPGKANAALIERGETLEWPFQPSGFPVELFSLTAERGNPMRITVEDFGPVMLARILQLNDTQTGVLAALFKYAEDQQLPLIDFADLKKLLAYLADGPGAVEIKETYGRISTSTSGAILRKIVAVEQQGVSHVFGEPKFDIHDLLERVDGKGVISLLNISDCQNEPILFSTFLLSLLAQLFKHLPEVGDLDQPKLVFFFDEAHLLFKDSSKAFRSQVEQIIRLIRSKGVGVFFCTQAPTDIPESVLGQLGNRVQHALRAFTPNDTEALRKTVRTYPRSDFYEIDRVLLSLGTGQALITVLNEKGIPTEVVATHLIPPRGVMGPLDEATYNQLVGTTPFYAKYHRETNMRSASEILAERINTHELKEERDKAENKKTAPKRRSARQTPVEAATKAASATLAREGVKLLGKIANGVLTALFRRKR